MDAKLAEALAFALDLPIDAITPDTSPNTVGTWDSMTNVLMLALLEQEFGLRFSASDRDRMRTAGEIDALLRERGAL